MNGRLITTLLELLEAIKSPVDTEQLVVCPGFFCVSSLTKFVNRRHSKQKRSNRRVKSVNRGAGEERESNCHFRQTPLLELINNARARVDLFCCEKLRCARTDAGGGGPWGC